MLAPALLIAINGTKGTMETIDHFLSKDLRVPVLLIAVCNKKFKFIFKLCIYLWVFFKGSGGLTGFLAQVFAQFKNLIDDEEKTDEEIHEKLHEDSKDSILNLAKKFSLENLITYDAIIKILKNSYYTIENTQNKLKKRIQLLNVFDFAEGQDLETTIIRSILNCKFNNI